MRLCPSERPAENIYSKGGFTQIGGQWWTIKKRNQPKRSIRRTPGHSWACRTCRWTSTTTKHYYILDIWPFDMMHDMFWKFSPLQRLLPGQARRRLWRRRGPSRGQRRWSSGSKKCFISKSFHKNYFSMNPKISIIQKDYSLNPHPRKVPVPIYFFHTPFHQPPQSTQPSNLHPRVVLVRAILDELATDLWTGGTTRLKRSKSGEERN